MRHAFKSAPISGWDSGIWLGFGSFLLWCFDGGECSESLWLGFGNLARAWLERGYLVLLLVVLLLVLMLVVDCCLLLLLLLRLVLDV